MTEAPRKLLTLCLIRDDSRVLLGMKKRGFGQGRWNGFGGKVKEGEAIDEAAKRETEEEIGIVVERLEPMGILEFIEQSWDNKLEVLEMHIFKVNKFSGEPHESDEMRPQWFNINEIPFSQMWPDDEHWFPLFLADKKFTGKFIFDANDQLLSHKLELQES